MKPIQKTTVTADFFPEAEISVTSDPRAVNSGDMRLLRMWLDDAGFANGVDVSDKLADAIVREYVDAHLSPGEGDPVAVGYVVRSLFDQIKRCGPVC